MLAGETGQPRTYVSKIEHGLHFPRYPTLGRILKALDFPLYKFLLDLDPPLDPLWSQLRRHFGTLDPASQKQVLDYARSLIPGDAPDGR